MYSLQQHYQEKAYKRAGILSENWRPEHGFKANEAILEQVYLYYQAVYQANPNVFLWAGLARLTGGQVLFGMRNAVKIARDPCALTCGIVAVAKDIFESLAWQHELFLESPGTLIAYWGQTKMESTGYTYAEAWQYIASGNPAAIALGNQMLLKNEQQSTIQPHYEQIREDAYANRFFRFTRFVMRNIHPYHRRFILEFPLNDVTRFEDRWKWITHPAGMWPRWVQLPQLERDRLVALSNQQVVSHQW
ncbi:MAG TPA: hypothetical protein VK168_07965 [Saprospiraceae bacterium]|nr:hypothetical protein [Saprospiraceae bacterium]